MWFLRLGEVHGKTSLQCNNKQFEAQLHNQMTACAKLSKPAYLLQCARRIVGSHPGIHALCFAADDAGPLLPKEQARRGKLHTAHIEDCLRLLWRQQAQAGCGQKQHWCLVPPLAGYLQGWCAFHAHNLAYWSSAHACDVLRRLVH